MSTGIRNTLVRKLTATLLGVVAPFVYSAPVPISQQQIAALVTEHFGPKVRTDISSGNERWMPRYLRVAFTKALPPVLVIPIHVDGAKGTLNARPFKAITEDGYDASPDETIGSNCLALAFLPDRPSEVHMLYECFSGYTRVAKGSTLLRNARVHAAGEAVLLDLETGGQLLVYWDGERYRTKLVRLGD